MTKQSNYHLKLTQRMINDEVIVSIKDLELRL